MALTVNTNLASLNAQRNLGLNNALLGKSLERLSSGLRVNRAADDAAGLSIASKLNFQARGLNQAVRNTGDATSLVQTAEGAFNVATNILGRLRELAVQAASDTNTASDRATLKAESDLLVAELTRLAQTTEFNGATLLDGSFTSGKVQVGANAEQTISFSLGDVRAAQLGKYAAFSLDIADGIGNASGTGSTFSGFGNLTTGEFKINGELVGATATTDDQVSVLELFYKNNLGTSLALGDGTPAFSGVAATSYGQSAVNSTSFSTAAVTNYGTLSGAVSTGATGGATATSEVSLAASLALSTAVSTAFSYYLSNGTNHNYADISAALSIGYSVANSAAASNVSTGTASFGAGVASAYLSGITSLFTSYAGSGTTSAFTSATADNLGLALAANRGALYINGTAVTSLANYSGASNFTSTQLSGAAFATNSAFVSAFVAKINAAGITNVTARQNADGSTYAIVAIKGTDVKLAYSNTGAVSVASLYSNIGLVSQVVGSGNAASEVSTYNGQSSAIAKAAAINSVKTKSGVTATAQQNDYSTATAITAFGLSSNDLIINGYAITATSGITASDGTGALRAAINAKTSSTGVTASVNSTGYLVLSAADGRNISVFASSNAASGTGLTSGVNVYRSSLKLSSQNDVSFSGTTTDIGNASTQTPYTADLSNSVSLIDISTQLGANNALYTLDAALTQLNNLRAQVGALQNRLDLTSQALQVSAENQTAAESRIRDADFAFETSRFTRNQILVQAGTAILAQANSSQQIALQLLQR